MLNVLSTEHISKEMKYWVRRLWETEVGALQRCWSFLVGLCPHSFSGSDRKGTESQSYPWRQRQGICTDKQPVMKRV